MRRKSKGVLRGKSGASLMFVLATMALLLALGTSVMAAASANAGAWLQRRDLNQLNLYADSMQRSIGDHLVNGGGLAKLIAEAMNEKIPYTSVAPGNNREIGLGDILPFELTAKWSFDGTDAFDEIYQDDITITVTIEGGDYTRYQPYEPPILDGDGAIIWDAVPMIPQTATISGTVEITCVLDYDTGRKHQHITTVATYKVDSIIFFGNVSDDIDDMNCTSSGDWEMTAYEKTGA